MKNSKRGVTFAYDVEKKRIIYQTEEHEKLFSNSMEGRFDNFQNPKIRKGEKVIPKFQFF